jgi:hypothetical protein
MKGDLGMKKKTKQEQSIQDKIIQERIQAPKAGRVEVGAILACLTFFLSLKEKLKAGGGSYPPLS